MRVLIIEDDALIAENLRLIVQSERHDVAGVATDRDAAVALLNSADVDLAFLDLRLSDGLTGLEVAAAAVSAGVTFVLVSANLRVLFVGMAGAAGVIAKPYDDHTIVETLRFLDRAIGGRSVIAPPCGLVLSLEWIERLGLKGFNHPAPVDPRAEAAWRAGIA